MKHFTATRTPAGAPLVTFAGNPLAPRNDLSTFPSAPFDWCTAGPGAQHLAVAMLAQCLRDEALAVDLSARFAEEILQKLPGRGWRLTPRQICDIAGALNTTAQASTSPLIRSILSASSSTATTPSADIQPTGNTASSS